MGLHVSRDDLEDAELDALFKEAFFADLATIAIERVGELFIVHVFEPNGGGSSFGLTRDALRQVCLDALLLTQPE